MNPSNARKHSDSRLETRLSRSKNLNSSSNATDSLLGGHSCSTSTTRKRKIDSCESVTTAAVSNLDADSSGGDGSSSTTSIHQSTQAKFSKHDEITSQQLMLAAGSPSSSSSSSQDDTIFMNLMMANDEDSTPGAAVTTHHLHNRFCEGLGDQRMRCPGVHRFEVYVSDTNLLGQQNHSFSAGQSRHSISNSAPFANSTSFASDFLKLGGHFQNARQQYSMFNKQNLGNFDSLNNIFGSSGLGGGGGGWPGMTNNGSLLAAGNAFWKSQKTSAKRFVFECELGDKWVESPLRKPCKLFRTVGKPVNTINQVMSRLELQGVKLLNVLSSGKFSHVFVGHLFSHRHKIAIKIYERKLRSQVQKPTNPGSQNKQNLKVFSTVHPFVKADLIPDEISIHKHLKHKNIVQLFYSEQIDQNYVSLMELCDHGSLSQLLKASPGSVLAEPICRRYFKDMLEALFYLHSQNIVHRDIRCDNFLVDYHDSVKLCDFTHATRFSNGDDLQTASYGNPAYLSPEILEERPFNPRTADVWALGVCLHVLCTSKLPFILIPTLSSDAHSSNRPQDIQTGKALQNAPPTTSQQQITTQSHSNMDLQNAEDNFTGKLGSLLSPDSTINNNPSAGSSTKQFDVEPLIAPPGLKIQPCPDTFETDPLTLMKKGLDLRVIAPSVNLSQEASELLKGLLHYVLKVRYSLNRARSSAWMKQSGAKEDEDSENEKPYIGNHYMLSTQQKFNSSDKEKALKDAFEI